MVSTFNDVGIGVHYTFTNHLLDKGDLDHPQANALLESIDNGRGLNGVILSSDVLFDYVRQRHPDLMLTASIIKVTEEERRGDVTYYRAAQERFDSVMMHPDDGFAYHLLDQLDRDKIEILVNEDCALRCPNRVNDYQVMASIIKAEITNGPELEYACTRKKYCNAPQGRLVPTIRCCNFTMPEMIQVYEMGFRRFKLQGRQNMPATFLFDLLRFAVEPELIAPIIYKSIVSGQATRLSGEAVRNVRLAHQQAVEDEAVDQRSVAAPDESTVPLPMVVTPPAVKACRLPTGPDGRHPLWPEARWTIGGLSNHGRVMRNVFGMLADRFECALDVSAHEELRGRWGRLKASRPATLNLDAVAETVQRFNDMNIGVRFAFGNGQLTSDDLDDETGNGVLEILDRSPSLNAVAVASDMLAEHIRSRHPELTLVASSAKTIQEGGCGRAGHYAALAERFDLVTLCPEDGSDTDLLEQLSPERMEVLVNDDAAWGIQSVGDRDLPPTPRETLAADVRSRNLTTTELKRIYDLGYRRFQLQDPSSSPNVFLYDTLRYLLEPNFLLPVIFKSFTNDSAELSKRRGA
jgi:hypothetical protein